MTPKHTPGPWTAAADNCGDGKNITDPKGRRIAHTAATRNNNGNPLPDHEKIETAEAKANAALIAAAPDMLAALQAMLKLHIAHHNEPTHAAARAAIARATGGHP